MATPKTNANHLWWKLFASLIIVLLVALIYSQFEKKTVKKNVAPSKEAQENRFLALDRLLKNHDFSIDYQEKRKLDISKLPDNNDILLLTGNAELQSERDQNSLISWLQKGGRLVLIVDSKTENQDSSDDEKATTIKVQEKKSSILEHWNIKTSRLKYDESFEKTGLEIDSKPHVDEGYNFELPLGNDKVQWHFKPYELPQIGFFYKDDNNIKNNNTIRTVPMPIAKDELTNKPMQAMVQFHEGKGQVLILNSDEWLSNSSLKNADNGYIALTLFDGLKSSLYPDNTIHIFSANRYNDIPNLLKWLWIHAKNAVIATILCVLLWLWRYRLISGPKLTPKIDARRDLLEHLDASAWFIYRVDKGQSWIQKLSEQFDLSLPKTMNKNVFIEQTHFIQQLVISKFNSFGRYIHFERRSSSKANTDLQKDNTP